MNIPNTGQLDRKTIAEMHKPRCGVPDFDDDDKPSPGKTYCNLREWSFFITCGGKVGGGGRREGYRGSHVRFSGRAGVSVVIRILQTLLGESGKFYRFTEVTTE